VCRKARSTLGRGPGGGFASLGGGVGWEGVVGSGSGGKAKGKEGDVMKEDLEKRKGRGKKKVEGNEEKVLSQNEKRTSRGKKMLIGGDGKEGP